MRPKLDADGIRARSLRRLQKQRQERREMREVRELGYSPSFLDRTGTPLASGSRDYERERVLAEKFKEQDKRRAEFDKGWDERARRRERENTERAKHAAIREAKRQEERKKRQQRRGAIVTQSRLKELLEYNPDSGIFVWNCSNGLKIKKGDIAGPVYGSGYRNIRLDGRTYPAHRLAWLYVHGKLPKNIIDHINHNRMDNSIRNLRDITPSQNAKNKNLGGRNKSGVMGVSRRNGRWWAQIKASKKLISLGFFDDFFEACCARKSAENRYGFMPEHGREC